MSRSWRRERAALFEGEAAAAAAGSGEARPLVGRDFSARRTRRGTSSWLPPVLLGGLVAALLLTSLHVQVIRLRYELADTLSREAKLMDEKRTQRARVSELRSPKRLRREAAALGLVRPERVIDLGPAPRVPSPDPAGAALGSGR